MLTLMFRSEVLLAAVLAGAHQALAEAIHQLAIGRREILEEAIDRFDDDAPLSEAGDGAEGIEARLELDRHPNAELRVVRDFLSVFGAGRRAASATTIFTHAIVGHSLVRWRSTAEMSKLRCASDACRHRRINASVNID